ncbi:hypothetical protein ASG17_01630 [Brevundimonas sp. Leaf363]|uniref:hypothetical protein n=1 Tax=Brevundimonas sp. Leaf363 TaxID=1736353 RepID=UPI0006F7F263|nr:hypothetical protein [Brevundimonas sp. Leaf363]KQS57449.1 hypothetical protein ASG17_01630 [Brevundimonas sp. Leaf363]
MARNLKTLLKRTLLGVLAFFVLCFVLGVAAGYLSAQDPGLNTDAMMFWFALVAGVVAMAAGMAASVAWMRSIDEAAREAHKAAWFWGGSGGMMVGGVGVILATLPQSADWTLPLVWFGRDDPVAWMAAGCFGSLLIMIAGYTVVWAWWWLARR